MFNLSLRSRDSHILTVDKETFISDPRFVANIRCHLSEDVFASWTFSKEKGIDMFKIKHILVKFTLRCSEKWPSRVRSEKMCDFITLSITEISPWDAGDYECQVSFTPKISRIIETLQSNLLSLAMSQKPPAITIEFYQTGGDIGQLFSRF